MQEIQNETGINILIYDMIGNLYVSNLLRCFNLLFKSTSRQCHYKNVLTKVKVQIVRTFLIF